ncbi:MAG: type I DNA topoisomerase [bacterium]|nr:type I DNA topoisomerase [bacterium]
MSHTLVIVESPTKSKTIGRYLEGWQPHRFRVASSVGHVVDLPERELGVDVEQGFEPRYVNAPRKAKVIAELRKLAKEADEVLLATDQDREGEAIAWHIANLLRSSLKKSVPVHRIRFNEITRQAIVAAVQQPEAVDQNRVDAQQARRVMDRLVGYQVSPILWKTVSRGLSAGRVQSVAVRLICEREEEIQAFVPEEYWSFTGHFRSAAGEDFEAELQRIFSDAGAARHEAAQAKGGEKPEVRSGTEAQALKEEMEAAAWRVHAINEKQVARKAPAPFTTSTLQQDAARRLGFSPKKTMMVAQQLYEGLELENGERAGLITYMRTDSVRLADSAVEEARAFLAKRYGPAVVPDKPVHFKGKGKAQDAHEAVRPTSLAWSPDQLAHSLNRDQLRLYTLIWNRFLACQMVPALFNQRSIDLLGGRFLFRATGSVLVRKGYLEVYEDMPEEKAEGGEAGRPRAVRARSGAPAVREKSVPIRIAEGEEAALAALDSEQHFTKPPARYSQESLIKSLEELGIGRPSTYASIVDMVLKRKYVELKERRFWPTPLGITVNRILVTHFAAIFNVDFTAQMELELDSVESGRNWREVVQDFYGPFAAALGAADSARAEIRASTREEVGEACPDCGQPLVYKHGRNGRFISCTNYPACKYSRNPGESGQAAQVTDEVCASCGAPMAVKHSRYGPFLGCSRYPECKQTMPFDLGAACPRQGCDGKLTERRSKKGRTFYGCTRFPACDFASWDRPELVACPSCDWPWMGRKTGRDRDHELTCPRCGMKQDADLLQQHAAGDS